MDFTLISRAGLTQREFAGLCGVSRVTTNLWVGGKMSPHRYIRDRIVAHMDTIHHALERGALPIAKDTPRAQRQCAIDRALKIPAATVTAN